MTQSQTSVLVRVRMEVEPNNVLQTSPERLEEDVEKIFIRRYPIAREATDIIAIAASPLIFVFCPVLRSKIAQIIVINKTRGISFVMLSIAAIAIAPKAT